MITIDGNPTNSRIYDRPCAGHYIRREEEAVRLAAATNKGAEALLDESVSELYATLDRARKGAGAGEEYKRIVAAQWQLDDIRELCAEYRAQEPVEV